MHVEMPAVPREALRAHGETQEADSAEVRDHVAITRARQLERTGRLNSALSGAVLERSCRLDADGLRLLDAACERLGLSARAYHRVLRLARTIADLDGATDIAPVHVGEAVGYRVLDRRSAEY